MGNHRPDRRCSLAMASVPSSTLRPRSSFVVSVALALAGCAQNPAPPTSDPGGDTFGAQSTHDASMRADVSSGLDARPDLDAISELDAVSIADAGADLDAHAADRSPRDGATRDAAASAGCGDLAGHPRFVCARDGNARSRCAPGERHETQRCDRGCLRRPPAEDSICMGTSDNWSCSGPYGTERALDGDYYISAFGCWLDAAGVEHTDPGDNCIPSCLAQAKRAGLCDASDSGRQCEERLNWFTADAARFGCLTRMRVTNPRNGKALIAIALDYGPGCPGERRVSKAVLDASGRINRYLFGSDQGASERSLVHVVEVDDSTPLGPIP